MRNTKIIIFEYQKGWNDIETDEFEFDINATDEEIQKEFEEWVWGLIADRVAFYEKE